MKRVALIMLSMLILCTMSVPAFAAADVKPVFIAYTNTDPNRYQIEIDITNQVVTVYEKGASGAYDQIVRQCICTTGAYDTPTPWGTFKMGERRERFQIFYEYKVWGQYWSNIVGGIYFHSVLYNRKDEKTLSYSSYNNLGRRASHGCIRLLVEDARWIYFNAPPGTTVNIVGDKPKDAALTKSLKPKTPANKYVAKPDSRYVDLPPVRARFAVDGVAVGGVKYKKGDVIYVRNMWNRLAFICLQDGSNERSVPDKYVYFGDGPVPRIFDMMRVKTDQAFLRLSASGKSMVLACFAKGTEAEILGSTTYYHLVTINGKKGYILKSDVNTFRVSVPENQSYSFSVAEIPLAY